MAKVNAKLATVAAAALFLGMLLAGLEAVAAHGKTAVPPTTSSSKAAASGDETAVPPGSSEAAGSGCEIPGTCDLKLGSDPKTRPGKPANEYSRGCSSINQCRG